MKRRRGFPSSLQLLICRIDMTALAAVLFVLIAAFAVHPVAELTMDVPDPPKINHATAMAGALREDMLLIAVTRDGLIWFDNNRTDPARLSQSIRERVSRGSENKVYIRADSRARYGTVVKALNGVRAAGVEQVAFLVDGPGSNLQ
jgi:biopolymer transport protein TolR